MRTKEIRTNLGTLSNLVPQYCHYFYSLTERGVLREVHALLRQRLVEILKGSYPQVVASGCDDEISGLALRLFEDFICCHNLLFTYSVLSSETGGKLTRGKYHNMSSFEVNSSRC